MGAWVPRATAHLEQVRVLAAEVQHRRDPLERFRVIPRMPMRPLRTASSMPRPCASAL